MRRQRSDPQLATPGLRRVHRPGQDAIRRQRRNAARFDGGPMRTPARFGKRLQRANHARSPKARPACARSRLPDGGRLALRSGTFPSAVSRRWLGRIWASGSRHGCWSDCRIELRWPRQCVRWRRSNCVTRRRRTGPGQAGCRFSIWTVENPIQRYINHVEQARRALS